MSCAVAPARVRLASAAYIQPVATPERHEASGAPGRIGLRNGVYREYSKVASPSPAGSRNQFGIGSAKGQGGFRLVGKDLPWGEDHTWMVRRIRPRDRQGYARFYHRVLEKLDSLELTRLSEAKALDPRRPGFHSLVSSCQTCTTGA